MDHTEHALAFMPHGMCYLWLPAIVWLMVVTNAVIALAYYAIPVLLLVFRRHLPDLPHAGVFVLFAIFILACGTGHVMSIVTIWVPVYWLTAFVHAVTAVASVGTAIAMLPVMSRLVRNGPLKAYLERQALVLLEGKNAALEAANARLSEMNADLQGQMDLIHRSTQVIAAREARIHELQAEIEQLHRQQGGRA